jgi:hypothetical protein
MSLSTFVRHLTALALLLFTPVTATWAAESHVVPITEVQARAVSASDSRRSNVEKLDRFLAMEPVQKAIEATKLNGTQVRQAAALLSDDDLARLASRADKIQTDLAAGVLSNQEITYILIALATAVIILVLVAAR